MTAKARGGIVAAVVVVATAVAAGSAGLGATRADARPPRWSPNLRGRHLVEMASSPAKQVVVGVVTGVAIDRNDHVWVMHRFRQVAAEVKDRVAPPVLEFDADLKFLRAWGGPGEGYEPCSGGCPVGDFKPSIDRPLQAV